MVPTSTKYSLLLLMHLLLVLIPFIFPRKCPAHFAPKVHTPLASKNRAPKAGLLTMQGHAVPLKIGHPGECLRASRLRAEETAVIEDGADGPWRVTAFGPILISICL
jgi:hypothetical protein